MNCKQLWMCHILSCFAMVFVLTACNGGGSDSISSNLSNNDDGNNSVPSNRALFTYNCDLQSLNAELRIVVEVIQSSGIVWGPGPNPDISAVIGTNSVTLVTSGDLRSSTGFYRFTGENSFADFFSTTTNERFRVRWVAEAQGITMIVNPFGTAPAQHFCQTTSAQFL